jgi:hypothetical protein
MQISTLSTLTPEEMEQERAVRDARMRGFTTAPASTQCDGQPLPLKTQPYKLEHIWWIGEDHNVVESCGKPLCRVCGPDYGPYDYGVTQQ